MTGHRRIRGSADTQIYSRQEREAIVDIRRIPSSNSKPSMSFFSIPPEVRVLIYQHLFSRAQIFVQSRHPDVHQQCHYVALLRTCSQIYREAHPILTESLTLRVLYPSMTLKDVLRPLGRHDYHEIKDITLDFMDHYSPPALDLSSFQNLQTLRLTTRSQRTPRSHPRFHSVRQAHQFLSGKHDVEFMCQFLKSRTSYEYIPRDADFDFFPPRDQFLCRSLWCNCNSWLHHQIRDDGREYRILLNLQAYVHFTVTTDSQTRPDGEQCKGCRDSTILLDLWLDVDKLEIDERRLGFCKGCISCWPNHFTHDQSVCRPDIRLRHTCGSSSYDFSNPHLPICEHATIARRLRQGRKPIAEVGQVST